MRILLASVLAISTAFSVGCTKASKNKEAAANAQKSSAGASRPVAMSTAVLATVELPTGLKMEGLVNAIDLIEPGASAMLGGGAEMMLGQAMGMDLSAADLDAPVAVIIVNPKKYSIPFVLLVTAKDSSKLGEAAKAAGLGHVSKNERSLVGDAAAVEAVRNAAFGRLAAGSKEMVARIYPGAALTHFKGDLQSAVKGFEAILTEQGGAFSAIAGLYQDLIIATGEQTAVIELRVTSSDGVSDLHVRLQPKPGTTMAALALAQVPSKHNLLGKLPAQKLPTMVVSGNIQAGAASKALMDFWIKSMEAMMPTGDGGMLKHATELMKVYDGQTAMTMRLDLGNAQLPTFEMTYLIGTTDALIMRKSWRGMLQAVAESGEKMMGMNVDVSFDKNISQVDGVEVDRYTTTIKPDGLSPEQLALMGPTNQEMHLATFDDVAAISASPNSMAQLVSIIESVRGKKPGYAPEGAMSTALARSKSLGESAVFAMDIESLSPAESPAPVSLITGGFGQDNGALTIRISAHK